MTIQFTPEDLSRWESMIGKKVWKKSVRKENSKFEPKPFKSGLKVNTVKGIAKHPYTDHWAFTFEEDESSVECFRCSLAPEGV